MLTNTWISHYQPSIISFLPYFSQVQVLYKYIAGVNEIEMRVNFRQGGGAFYAISPKSLSFPTSMCCKPLSKVMLLSISDSVFMSSSEVNLSCPMVECT